MLPSNNTSRQFSEISISADCRLFSGIEKVNALLYDCEFEKLDNCSLINCDLNNSKINPKTLKDLLNLTLTLNCHSFKNVELNELAFDSLLMLLCLTKGNDLKKQKLIEIIGNKKFEAYKKIFGDLE